MSAISSYTAGETVRLYVAFTSASVAADPTTIDLYVRHEDGGTQVHKTTGQLTKTATGAYEYHYVTDSTLAANGAYFFDFLGTWSNGETTAYKGMFVVASSPALS